jgi:hypothetical protein
MRMRARRRWGNPISMFSAVRSLQLRVLDAVTGKKYVRPREAQGEADARREAEEKLRVLQEEVDRLRKTRRRKKP